MKNYIKISLLLISLNSCVFDFVHPFFVVKNNTNKNIRIYFSNFKAIDSISYLNRYSIVYMNHIYTSDKFQNDFNNKTQIYMYVYDEDSIKLYLNSKTNKIAIKRAFLQRWNLYLNKLNSRDTLIIN